MKSQADPKFQSTFLYARVIARALRENLPNRMGYRLKKFVGLFNLRDQLSSDRYSLPE